MKTLSIKMTYRELELLHEMYVGVLTSWRPEGDIEHLLRDHAREMEQELKVKLAKEVQKPKLVMSRSAARAFWMLWQEVQITGSEKQQVIINGLIGEADRYLLQPQAVELKRQNTGV